MASRTRNPLLPPIHLPLRVHSVLRSRDIYELEELISKGDFLERRILAYLNPRRRLNAHLSHFPLNRTQLVGVQLGAFVEAKSVPLKATQILIPFRGRILDNSRNAKELTVGRGSAVVHNIREPVRVLWEPDSCCLSVRIPEASLQRVFHAFYGDFLPDNFRFYPTLSLAGGSGRSLENILAAVLKEIEERHELITDRRVAELWEELLIVGFLRTQPQLEDARRAGEGVSSHLVYSYVRRAIDFMMSNLGNRITIDDLVRESGVPLRTLQNGFNRCFGTGPMTYLRCKRLTEASAELAAANPNETTVGDIAAKWQFYNASHFAAQYRRMFGELPSATLSATGRKAPRAQF